MRLPINRRLRPSSLVSIDAALNVWKTPAETEPRVSLERYKAHLRHFVRSLKSKNTRVVLRTSNPLRWTPKLKAMYGKPPYTTSQRRTEFLRPEGTGYSQPMATPWV